MRTKKLYGINNNSNDVGVVRMYVTTCVTSNLQMNPNHLQQFLPNLHKWISVNQLFQAQLASSKRMVLWQTLRFTNKLWNEHNFEDGSSAKIIHNLHGDQQITHFRFMGNGSRYIRTHYAIAFIVNSIHVFSHLRLKSAIKDFKTSATAVTCAHNQWWHSKKERNISARAITCAQN